MSDGRLGRSEEEREEKERGQDETESIPASNLQSACLLLASLLHYSLF